jgi:hypothetical protein
MKLNPNMTARERNYAIQPGGAGSPSAYVFRDIAERQGFVETLAEVCAKPVPSVNENITSSAVWSGRIIERSHQVKPTLRSHWLL